MVVGRAIHRPWPVKAVLAAAVINVAYVIFIVVGGYRLARSGMLAPELEAVHGSTGVNTAAIVSNLLFLMGAAYLFSMKKDAISIFIVVALIEAGLAVYLITQLNTLMINAVWLLLLISIPYSLHLRRKEFLR